MRGERPQAGHRTRADVLAKAGNDGQARIIGSHGIAAVVEGYGAGLAPDLENREIRGRREVGRVPADTDIHQAARGDVGAGMIDVVARRTLSGHVVAESLADAADIVDDEGLGVEQDLPASDGLPRGRFARRVPSVVFIEHRGGRVGLTWRLGREGDRPARRAVGGQPTRLSVADLSTEDPGLESDNLIYLLLRWRVDRLCMAQGGAHRLSTERWLPAIPHYVSES